MRMCAVLLAVGVAESAAAEPSRLWGHRGERWDPRGRLPDFSYAGYQAGRAPIPEVPVVSNVRDFGAVGDGATDDTRAFQDALAAAEGGALLVPAGRYLIRGKLAMRRSNVVLRGEGPDRTVL
ncbi:MAG TPA: glycosyl hydrolase family 28-related protein, partial [Kofleriaceae bacterium]|nr:glycosyl hydrolase family 28-related protein [Kofleriaceae bacterium]